MSKKNVRRIGRLYRHKRLRKKVSGTSDCPRLCVYRSLKNLSAQVIDDTSGHVLLGMTTLAKELKDKINNGGNICAATVLGEFFAKKYLAHGVKKVVFDRGGYSYHGRVKAFAESARKYGMEF